MPYMAYSTVTDLVYSVEDKSAFTCTVHFDAIGPVPFGATNADVEEHGREIYNRGIAGDFGPIAPFVAPPAPPAPPSVECTLGGKTVVVDAAICKLLLDACYKAVAMGDGMVTIPVGAVNVTATLQDARAAIKAFETL